LAHTTNCVPKLTFVGVTVPQPAPKTEVGLLLYPGCQSAMIHGMTDLLQIASGFSAAHDGPMLRVSHWSRNEDGTIARSQDSHPGSELRPEILIVPGRLSGPVEHEEARPYAAWLRARHADGATLASNCGGAFLLAETGLLDGRPATTHWLFGGPFRDRFPKVLLDTDKIVIEDGELMTAGGLMAWTDLGMRLVDRLLGPTIMVETGQFLLIDPAGREQRHFSNFTPRLTHGDEAILKVQHWLQGKAAKAITVPDMAREASLEERTFQRRFKAATGLKPTEYAQHLRVGKARELLQFTRRPVDQIAWTVGYEDTAAFRRLFHKLIGVSPGDYRRRFGAQNEVVGIAA
jgi:transcriptional regulator GlxA family with amidase domain